MTPPTAADLPTVGTPDPLVGATGTAWKDWVAATATANRAPAWSSAFGPGPVCTVSPGADSINAAQVTVAAGIILDARAATSGCPQVTIQGMTLKLEGDLTLVADSVRTTGRFSAVSADGAAHRLRLVVASGSTGDIDLAGRFTADPSIEVEIVTAGTARLQTRSGFTGSVKAGRVLTTGEVTITGS